MFCRYCGKKIYDDSIFCSFCGKQLIPEKEPGRTIGPPFKSDPEIVWDLKEFPERRKTEDIRFSWEREKPVPEKPEPVSEFASKIDKFYTFNQKNEEFQKLLDKEYERVKNAEFQAEEEEEVEETSPAVEKTGGDTLIFNNEVLAKKFDTNEFNKDLIESALERAGLSAKDYTISPDAEKDLYESEFKPQFLEDIEGDNEDEDDDEDDDEDIDTEEADEETIAEETGEETDESMPITDPQKQEAFKELERLWDAYEQEKKEKFNYGQEKTVAVNEITPGKEGQKKKGKNKIGKVILTFLLILLLLEISIIAVKWLAPESAAAAFINDKLKFATMWFDGSTGQYININVL